MRIASCRELTALLLSHLRREAYERLPWTRGRLFNFLVSTVIFMNTASWQEGATCGRQWKLHRFILCATKVWLGLETDTRKHRNRCAPHVSLGLGSFVVRRFELPHEHYGMQNQTCLMKKLLSKWHSCLQASLSTLTFKCWQCMFLHSHATSCIVLMRCCFRCLLRPLDS